MILPVYLYGQPVLRKTAEDITKDYPNLDQLIQNMFETMYKSEGIGLAAPQIGLPIRMFVIDLDALSDTNPEYKGFKKVFINAHVVSEAGEEVSSEEGCLSIPGVHETVKRKSIVTMKYMDENFVEHEDTFSEFFARVVMHEYDHLDGKMFIDKISPIRKQLIKAKLNNIVKGKAACEYKNKPVSK